MDDELQIIAPPVRKLETPGEAPEPSICAICLERDACVASVSCGHMFLCTNCHMPPRAPCPICKKTIHTMVRIWAVGKPKAQEAQEEEREVKEVKEVNEVTGDEPLPELREDDMMMIDQ